ncbi:MAG TPA: segregation/condensation protein A [Pirellulales bacterium]
MTYRVELDVYRGPMEILLYLVRKHELSAAEIPVSRIAQQFSAYLDSLIEHARIDFNDAGDFLVAAATLAEIKSREVLPQVTEEVVAEEPRADLVKRLIEYKKYRDAASILEERARRRQQLYSRIANDVPPRTRNLADEPLHELELWDLVSAYSRVMRDNRVQPGTNIVYDDTPIEVYMERIKAQLDEAGRLALSELFRVGMHKSTLVGLFLATLELVRHYGVRTEQEGLFDEIWLLPGPPMAHSPSEHDLPLDPPGG